MTGVCEFASFYRAVHAGREPFPWQRRLAALVEQSGWPAEIGVPTGLGKTSCIDVAVWALARQASRLPSERTAPTRTWYVVNRRLLVDSGFDQAVQLAKLLEDPDLARAHGGDADSVAALQGVADALSTIRGGAGALPLHVTRLRGGAELGARPPDPSQPALIFATVPMFASRWLFRGFGTSASMRPVDAALAGIDTLVLLDEAHLARPMRDLASPLAECDIGDPSAVVAAGRTRPVFVSLTATGDADDTFTLDNEDAAHPVVRRRVHAAKPVHLRSATDKTMPAALARQVQESLAGRDPASVVVFVNTPRRAREVFGQITSHNTAGQFGHAADLELLTGLMRDREADAVRQRLLDPDYGAPAGRDRTIRTRHLIVVATQTLEVGADLDFDVLVTEVCGARSLIQRMGRLNRLGDSGDPARDDRVRGGRAAVRLVRRRAAAGMAAPGGRCGQRMRQPGAKPDHRDRRTAAGHPAESRRAAPIPSVGVGQDNDGAGGRGARRTVLRRIRPRRCPGIDQLAGCPAVRRTGAAPARLRCRGDRRVAARGPGCSRELDRRSRDPPGPGPDLCGTGCARRPVASWRSCHRQLLRRRL